jgi:hypothetical protein
VARRLFSLTVGSGMPVVEGTTLAAQGTAIQALITTALANANGSHDSTTDITAIQTAVTAATNAWAGNVVVDVDMAKLTKLDQWTTFYKNFLDVLRSIGVKQ